jgi:hypothetical protein
MLLSATPLHGQTDATRSPRPTDHFAVGETLEYEIKFGFITLGKAMMHVAGIDTVRSTPTLHTVFAMKGGLMSLYRLHDRMDSWIGLDDFASRRFVQDFHEGNSFRYTAWDIYPDSGVYRQEGTAETLPTSVDPLDDYAFFYFARTLDFAVGQRHEFNRYFRPDRNPVVIEVVGRDTLDLPAGRFTTFVVHPIIQGRGILAEGREARMWISDDDRRLVVQLKVKFPFGTIALRLLGIPDGPPKDLLERPSEGAKR